LLICCSAANKPDERDAKHSGEDAGHTQRRLRALDRACRKPFRGARKRREKKSFDRKNETDRNQELGHLSDTAAGPTKGRYRAGGLAAGALPLGAAAPPALGVPSRDLPLASPKYLKKSESGLSSIRVSFGRRPFS